MESAPSLDTLSAGLSGFGHPLRIRILVLMDKRETTPRELAEVLGAPLGVTSYHVRMLREYGLIVGTRQEPRRGALAHFYRRTELAETLLAKLNGTLAVPAVGRFTAERRREALAEWATTAG